MPSGEWDEERYLWEKERWDALKM